MSSGPKRAAAASSSLGASSGGGSRQGARMLSMMLCLAGLFSAAEACQPWQLHQATTAMNNKVNPNGCNLMGGRPPCSAGRGDDVENGDDYLWLGELKSITECITAAEDGDALEVSKLPSCKTVTYYGDQAQTDLRSQCYCGTTRTWDPTPQPGATSGQYVLRECWGWPFIILLALGDPTPATYPARRTVHWRCCSRWCSPGRCCCSCC